MTIIDLIKNLICRPACLSQPLCHLKKKQSDNSVKADDEDYYADHTEEDDDDEGDGYDQKDAMKNQ